MKEDSQPLVDHLFRHHYGKMVSTLTRIFGLNNLGLIEDAVQDTFVKALMHWQNGIPPNPEGWLTAAAKNRAIDLFRKIKSDHSRAEKVSLEYSENTIEQLFLDYQIEDSQLRMIFTACHPVLNPKDQIAFALKTIAGFSDKEIAVALLLKLETVKKRLSRARKTIKEQGIAFAIPNKEEMIPRLDQVHNVLYLIFNEGFHSTQSALVLRKELCGEAMRLCSLILKKQYLRTGKGYALFGLFCFHAARLDTKLSSDQSLIDLKNQDRTQWDKSLIDLGNEAMHKAMDFEELSIFHLEAAIATEHVKASSFETTNWEKIKNIHEIIHQYFPSDFSILNQAIVFLQLDQPKDCLALLKQIKPENLEKRAYLFYGLYAEYYLYIGDEKQAIASLNLALSNVSNEAEKAYLEKKRANLLNQ